jgi:hypothetical protein
MITLAAGGYSCLTPACQQSPSSLQTTAAEALTADKASALAPMIAPIAIALSFFIRNSVLAAPLGAQQTSSDTVPRGTRMRPVGELLPPHRD